MFIGLHVHTMFSLLDSNAKPEDIVKRLKSINQNAIAITEHGNLYSSIYMYKLCKKNNIKYIHGCEAYICQDATIKDKGNRYNHIILLSKNEEGRINLNKLISKAGQVENFYYKPRIDFNMLKEHKDGLIVLSACMAGEVQRHLLKDEIDTAKILVYKYKEVFGDDYYLEIQSHTEPTQQMLNTKIVQLAKQTGVQWVATTDSHYVSPEDQKYHDIFVQIGQERETGETYNDCYLQSEYEVRDILSCCLSEDDIDVAIKNTEVIANKCNIEIPIAAPLIPHISVPSEFKNEIEYLKHLCIKGWKFRNFHLLPDDERLKRKERLAYEFNAITKMGFEGYFLLVYSYVNVAKRRGIARGSGGGSIIAYLLNIVDIDPVTYGLYFERFIDVSAIDLLEQGLLKPEELKIPDVDTDFGKADREKVVEYIVETYGKDRVASLGTFQYIWAKGAIKDIGKVLGISFDITNKITKTLDKETIEEALDLGLLDDYREDYPELFDYAEKLAGLPKSFSMHPCFTEDHLVMTNRGYKKIQNIKRGDVVLTHNNRFKKVHKTMNHVSNDIYSINVMGSQTIYATSNHPFYLRKRLNKRNKIYSNPVWIQTKDIAKGDMVGVAINQNSIVPEGILPYSDINFWWIVGRYIGDGWTSLVKNNNNNYIYRNIICCNKNNNEIETIIKRVGSLFKYHIVKDKTTSKIIINNKHLYDYLNTFGKYAYGKKLTHDIFDLPIVLLESFLDGYFSADGYFDKKNYQTFKTVSKELAYGMQSCIHKVYHKICGMTLLPPKQDVIDGRIINSKQKYVLTFKKHNSKNDTAFYENGYIWTPVRTNYKNNKRETVYNFEVEDDNSYTINNLIVHNCGKIITMQDLSYYNATSTNNGNIILQGDMNDAESLGLVKIDALGLRTVDVIYDTLEMLGKSYDDISPQKINFQDEKVLNVFKQGNTIGVFQFESTGMKSTLKKMMPTGLDDLGVANALYRPGAMKYIDTYINRKHGIEEYKFLHPDLEIVLKPTYGIIVFQEQLIEIGRIAGMRNADDLRKATGKKKPELMAKVEPELRDGLYKRGWRKWQVDELWEDMLAFAKYSFNKSHAYAYAMIAYICAYLKTYHPHEFYCAYLNSYIDATVQDKMIKLGKIYEDAKNNGVFLNSLDIKHPSSRCEIINNKINYALPLIKYCNTDMVDYLKVLSNKKFDDFIDLLIDISENNILNTKQVTILIILNYFSEYGNNQKLLSIYNAFSSGKDVKYDRSYVEKTKVKRIESLKKLLNTVENKKIRLIDQAKYEMEYLGFMQLKEPEISDGYYIVADIKIFKDKLKPTALMYNIKSGMMELMKVKNAKLYAEQQFKVFDLVKVINKKEQHKYKKDSNDNWTKSDELEMILDEWIKVI